MGQIHRQTEIDLIELINVIKKNIYMFSINQVFNSFPSICKTLVLSTVLLENWRHVDFINGKR